MRILLQILLLLVAAPAFALMCGGISTNSAAGSPNTFIVNDDRTPAKGGCSTPDFETEDIEDAINSELVSDGDALIICEGTYDASFDIYVSKSLTIEGRAAANRDEIVIKGGVDNHGFTIWSDDVLIGHMKLIGPGTTGNNDGVRFELAPPATHDRAQITDLEVTNWTNGVFISGSHDIDVGPDNFIHGNAEGVVILNGSGSSRANRVFNNVIGPNGYGIDLSETDETYIQNNTMVKNTPVNDVIGPQIPVTGVTSHGDAFIWNNDIEVTVDYGVAILSPAGGFVQIGGSPDHANVFEGNLEESYWNYVQLECESATTVDATYNYWNGISSYEGISAVVFNDEYDDPSSPSADCPGNHKSTVTVHPWLARTINLSPPGWHDLAWSGLDDAEPINALACISGQYSVAYAWEGPSVGFTRYVDGCPVPGICNMGPLDQYDPLLVHITAEGVTCDLPVAPMPQSGPEDKGGPPETEPPPPATLVAASGEQTSGVHNYCWKGLCVDEPLTFQMAIEPTQLDLLVWPTDAGTVVKEYEGFYAWRGQGDTGLKYELPPQSSLQFTPALAPGKYVIVLAVRALEGSVGYAFQVEVVS